MSNFVYAKYGTDGLQAQNPDDLAQPQIVYLGPWAGRPVGAAVPVGAEMICTNIGIGGRSKWWWDGTYWRPSNGKVALFQKCGTVAAPLYTLVESASAQNYTLPSPLLIPNGVLYPGAKLCAELSVVRVSTAGTPGIQDVTMRLGPANTTADLAVIAVASIGGSNGAQTRVNGYCKVPEAYTTSLYCSYRMAPTHASWAAGQTVDRIINIAQDLFVSFGQTGDGGGDTSTYGLNEYEVWLEG